MLSHKEQESRIQEVREELGVHSPLYELAGTRVFTPASTYLLEVPSQIQEKISSLEQSQPTYSLRLSPLAGTCLYLVILSVLFLVYFPIDSGINSQFAQNNLKAERVESSEVTIDDALLHEMPENELMNAYQEVLIEEVEPETDSSYRERAYEEYLMLHVDEHTLMQSIEP
ncbi:MAG: hypothetical protein LW707_06570 [Sphingobacteriales bacterium]|jgi:hypothetical protein|nr:hypothetical protein [Sphingobacteriales bacterium]